MTKPDIEDVLDNKVKFDRSFFPKDLVKTRYLICINDNAAGWIPFEEVSGDIADAMRKRVYREPNGIIYGVVFITESGEFIITSAKQWLANLKFNNGDIT